MAIAIAVLAAVVLVGLGLSAVYLRREPGDDTDRFHHAQQLTSSWSEGYSGAETVEQPEAFEDKPEMQHNVHLVDA